MSKIEVNAVEPQSGTTLTLGASGDTVALAAGATANIYNGTVNWSSTIRTSGFTAVSGNGYFCDTTTAAFTVTLPASPAFGDIVAVKDWSSTSATNNITIARNGNLIEGNTTDAKISNHGAATTLVYSGASRGWMVTDSGDTQDLQIPQFIAATGGTVLTCGNYKTHVFTGPGSFVVSSGGNDQGSNSVEYLVVAGGGSGGRYTSGGGGAGGYRQNYPSPEFAGLPVTATTYPITVGAGGSSVGPAGPATGNNLHGNRGSSSIFSTITATGGGAGGGCNPGTPGFPSVGPGGSGGGVGRCGPAGGSGNTPLVSPSQGNNGGAAPGGDTAGGGGGGAGGVGAAGVTGSPGGPSTRKGGDGGIGSPIATTFFGPTAPTYGTPGPAPGRYFSGGGAAGTYDAKPGTTNPGGAGGGGPAFGVSVGATGLAGTAGTTNTGGGGGSCATSSGNSNAPGAGGSGIVVIRYKFQ